MAEVLVACGSWMGSIGTAERLGAWDVVTFGGRLPENAEGFIAEAMARNGMAGDWRRVGQAAARAEVIADDLGG